MNTSGPLGLLLTESISSLMFIGSGIRRENKETRKVWIFSGKIKSSSIFSKFLFVFGIRARLCRG